MELETYDVTLLRHTRSLRQEIKKLYVEQSLPVDKIAKRLKLTQKTIYLHLRNMGIELRPRQRDKNGRLR